MIQVTKQVDYGLQFLLALRDVPPEGCLSLRQFAKERNLSFLFMQKIVRALRQAGILTSVKGAQGGYKLAVSPKDITLQTLIEAIHGTYRTVSCLSCGDCVSVASCTSKGFFSQFQTDVMGLMNTYTLSDIPSKPVV